MPPEIDAVVHDFQECLEWSASLSDERSWVEFYRRLWPDMISCVRIDKDSKWQRWGVDREIVLPGKHVYIDEKKREGDKYTDVLLEEWSVADFDWERREVKNPRKVGWALDADKRCDYVAYSIPANGLCYMLPFELLRSACFHNIPRWRENPRWYPKPAKNPGYVTINVAVPWSELQRALIAEMRRFFSAAGPDLPIPRAVGKQLTFDWLRPHVAAIVNGGAFPCDENGRPA